MANSSGMTFKGMKEASRANIPQTNRPVLILSTAGEGKSIGRECDRTNPVRMSGQSQPMFSCANVP